MPGVAYLVGGQSWRPAEALPAGLAGVQARGHPPVRGRADGSAVVSVAIRAPVSGAVS